MTGKRGRVPGVVSSIVDSIRVGKPNTKDEERPNK